MRALPILAIGALLVSAASCTDDDDATEDAMSDVCDAQDDVMSDLSALVALDPSTNTTEDYQSVLGDIEDDVENLVSARSDLGDADVDSVESAFDDVRSELEGLDDEPLSEVLDDAGQAVVDGAADLMQQYETAYDNSSCTE